LSLFDSGLLNIGLVFGFIGLYVIFYYIELYARDNSSISSVLGSYLLVILNASSLIGRLVPGYYADMIGSINVQIMFAVVSMVLSSCLLAIHNEAGLIWFCILFGCSAGAFMALPAAGVVRLSSDPSKIGTRLGMTLGFVGCGVLVSNPTAGGILGSERHEGWVGLIAWTACLLAVLSGRT
jgi:predicted MFS family arabinose efflux permease